MYLEGELEMGETIFLIGIISIIVASIVYQIIKSSSNMKKLKGENPWRCCGSNVGYDGEVKNDVDNMGDVDNY